MGKLSVLNLYYFGEIIDIENDFIYIILLVQIFQQYNLYKKYVTPIIKKSIL